MASIALDPVPEIEAGGPVQPIAPVPAPVPNTGTAPVLLQPQPPQPPVTGPVPPSLPPPQSQQPADIKSVEVVQQQWIKLKHPKKDLALEKLKLSRYVFSPYPLRNWYRRDPSFLERRGIKATGRTLLVLGEDGAVKTLAPCSLVDVQPKPALLSRGEFEEIVGPGLRVWASEGGKHLAVKAPSAGGRDMGFELVDLASGARSRVPFEAPNDMTASVSTRGSGNTPDGDWDRIFVDDEGDAALCAARYLRDTPSTASSGNSVLHHSTKLFLYCRNKTTITLQGSGAGRSVLGRWIKLPSAPFDPESSPRTSQIAVRYSHRDGDGKWLSLAAGKTLAGAQGLLDIRLYQLHVPIAEQHRRDLQWRSTGLRLSLMGAGPPGQQPKPVIWSPPLIAWNESADAMALGLSSSEGRSVVVIVDTALSLIGKGLVLLRDFGEMQRLTWAGDKMIIAQDATGRHAFIDPDVQETPRPPSQTAAAQTTLDREIATAATSVGSHPFDRWLGKVLPQRRLKQAKPLGLPVLETFFVQDRFEDARLLYAVVGMGKRLGVLRLSLEGPAMNVQCVSRNPMRSHVAVQSVGTTRFAYTRARARNLMYQRLRKALLERKIDTALHLASFSAGKTPLSIARSKTLTWNPAEVKSEFQFPAGLPILLAVIANNPLDPACQEARVALALCALQAPHTWRMPKFSREAMDRHVRRERDTNVYQTPTKAIATVGPSAVAVQPTPAPAQVVAQLEEAGERVLAGDYDAALDLYRLCGKPGWAPQVAMLVMMDRLPEALDLVSSAAAVDIANATAAGGASNPAMLALPPPDRSDLSASAFGSREIAHLMGKFLSQVLAAANSGVSEGMLRGDFPSPLTLANMNLGFESYERLDQIRCVTVSASSLMAAERQLGVGSVKRVATGLLLWGSTSHWSKADLQGYHQEILRGLRQWARGGDHARAWTLALHICRLSLHVTAGARDPNLLASGGMNPATLARAESAYAPVMNFAVEMVEAQLHVARTSLGIDQFCAKAGELANLAIQATLARSTPALPAAHPDLQLTLAERALLPILDELAGQLGSLVLRAADCMASPGPAGALEAPESLSLRRSLVEKEVGAPVQRVLVSLLEVVSRYLRASGAPSDIFQAIDIGALARHVGRSSLEVGEVPLSEVFPNLDVPPEQIARTRLLLRILAKVIRIAWACHCVLNAREAASIALSAATVTLQTTADGASPAALASAFPQPVREALAWALEAAQLADVNPDASAPHLHPTPAALSLRAEMISIVVQVAESGVQLPLDLIARLGDLTVESLQVAGPEGAAAQAGLVAEGRSRLAAAETSVEGLRALMAASPDRPPAVDMLALTETANHSREAFAHQILTLINAHVTGASPALEERDLKGQVDFVTWSLLDSLHLDPRVRHSMVQSQALRPSDCAAHPLSLNSLDVGSLRMLPTEPQDEDMMLSSMVGWSLPPILDWEHRASVTQSTKDRLAIKPAGEDLNASRFSAGPSPGFTRMQSRSGRPAASVGDGATASVSGAPPSALSSLQKSKALLRAVKTMRGQSPGSTPRSSQIGEESGAHPAWPSLPPSASARQGPPEQGQGRHYEQAQTRQVDQGQTRQPEQGQTLVYAPRSLDFRGEEAPQRGTAGSAGFLPAEPSHVSDVAPGSPAPGSSLYYSGHVSPQNESSDFVMPKEVSTVVLPGPAEASPRAGPSRARSPGPSKIVFDMNTQTSREEIGLPDRRAKSKTPPAPSSASARTSVPAPGLVDEDELSDTVSDVSNISKDWKQARRLARMRVLKQRMLDPTYGGGRKGDAMVEAYLRVKAREAQARGLDGGRTTSRRLLSQEEIIYGPTYRPRTRVAAPPHQPVVINNHMPGTTATYSNPLYAPAPVHPIIYQGQPPIYVQAPPVAPAAPAPSGVSEQTQFMTALANILLTNAVTSNSNVKENQALAAAIKLLADKNGGAGNGNGANGSSGAGSGGRGGGAGSGTHDGAPSYGAASRTPAPSMPPLEEDPLTVLDRLRKRAEEREKKLGSAPASPAKPEFHPSALTNLKPEPVVDPLPRSVVNRVLEDSRAVKPPASPPAPAAPSDQDQGALAKENLRRLQDAALHAAPVPTLLDSMPRPPRTPPQATAAPEPVRTDAGLPPLGASSIAPRQRPVVAEPSTAGFSSRFLSVSEITEGDMSANLPGFEPGAYRGSGAGSRDFSLIDSASLRALDGVAAEEAMRIAAASQHLDPTEAERAAYRARVAEAAAKSMLDEAHVRATEARARRLEAEVGDVQRTLNSLEEMARGVERSAVTTQLMMEEMRDERRRQNAKILEEALKDIDQLKADLGPSYM